MHFCSGFAAVVDHFVALVDPFENAAVEVGHLREAGGFEFFGNLFAAVAYGAIHHNVPVFGDARHGLHAEIVVPHVAGAGDMAYVVFGKFARIEQDDVADAFFERVDCDFWHAVFEQGFEHGIVAAAAYLRAARSEEGEKRAEKN